MHMRTVRYFLLFFLVVALSAAIKDAPLDAQGCVYQVRSGGTRVEALGACDALGSWSEAKQRCQGIPFNC